MSRKNPSDIDHEIKKLLSGECNELKESDSATIVEETQAADCLQFLARLYLLATGDARQSAVVDEPKETKFKQAITSTVNLPVALFMSVDSRQNKDMAAWVTLYEDNTGNPDTARYVRIVATVDCCKVLKTADISAIGDSFMRKRVIAAGLLETLAACIPGQEYTVEPETLALVRKGESNTFSAFLECLAVGKVSACPVCGKPVYMPRKSSTPYCMASHKTRYNERAEKMFKGGASVDDVALKYPYIGRDTIEGWRKLAQEKATARS